jgi:lipid-binding SYLF domain-containing protein
MSSPDQPTRKDKHMSHMMNSMYKLLAFIAVAITLAFAQTAHAGTAAEIDAAVKDALKRFSTEVKGGPEFLNSAKGMLVFPKVYKGGFIVGVEGGEGALLVGGQTADYYRTAAASWGLQAGAQAKTVIVAFMTDEALQKFRNSSGWKAGVDGSVAMVDVGAGAALDTKTIKDPVVGFVFGQTGLMANLTLEGSKYEKFTPGK